MKLTFSLIFAVLVAAVGSGFQHGYNISVLNNPEELIKSWVGEKTGAEGSSRQLYWGFIVSLLPFGGLVGALFTKIVCDMFGRKGGLIINSIIAIVAGVIFGLTKTANSVVLLFLGRLLIGINSGLNAGLAPVYVCEISPTKIRGAMGSLYQLNITISILIAQLLGFESVMGTEKLWPLLLSVVGFVGLLQFICLFFCQESPRFLLEKKNNEEKAQEGCKKLAGEDFQQQLTELKNDIEDAKKLPPVTLKEMFTQKKLRVPLILICTLMTAQQLSGINAIMFYSTEIIKTAQFSVASSQLATIGIGLVNVIVTIVSVWLVEASGRKPLLLLAFGGMVFSMSALFVTLYFVNTSSFMKYLAVFEIVLYVIFFAVGAGSVPWLLGPELFNTASRALGCTFAVVVNWSWTFVVGLLFPSLQALMGPAVFVIFIICNALAFAFVWICCPETKNKSIDEITAFFE